jgi:cobalt-zinc-cadmium efflux system protein
MASDAVSLVLVLFAIRMARRPASPQHTFGHHRAEILAATANGSLLLAIAGGIVVEAVERMSHPAPVLGGPMMAVAAGGLVVNLLGLAIFASARNGNLNLRAAWLHVLSDALGSVGAMAAAGAVLGFGWTWTDPAVSCLIALLVVRGAWQLLQEALGVLMEGAPSHIDVSKVREALRSRPGVLDVHDLHVWTIGSGKVAMSGHIVTAHDCPSAPMLRVLRDELKDRFGISHATIQLEPPGFLEDDLHP